MTALDGTSPLPWEKVRNQRQLLRDAAIAARLALTPTERQILTDAIVAQVYTLLCREPAQCVGFYWPWQGEPDLRDTICAWLRKHPGVSAALPVVTQRNAPLLFAQWAPDTEMMPDRYGIPTPRDPVPCTPDMLLIPVNAFDAQCYRLGYGGGYYDRTLASATPRPFALGIGFELARVPTIFPQPFDIPLNAIVTEGGMHTA